MTDGETLQIERTFQAPAEAEVDLGVRRLPVVLGVEPASHHLLAGPGVEDRLGGAVRVVMRNPHDGVEYGGGGTYTEIDPPTRLAFTWIWDDDEDRQTMIELDFEENDGTTTVRLTHSNLRDEDSVRSHEGGWSGALDNLGRAVEVGA